MPVSPRATTTARGARWRKPCACWTGWTSSTRGRTRHRSSSSRTTCCESRRGRSWMRKRRQHLPRPHRRLRDSLRRRDERNAEKPFAACTEPRAWQHDYALLLHEPVGKLCARNPVGERQPEIHRAFWRIAREPVLAECLHRGIAPLLEYGDVAGHPALPALERGDAGALHGHELARVEKALHSRERRD